MRTSQGDTSKVVQINNLDTRYFLHRAQIRTEQKPAFLHLPYRVQIVNGEQVFGWCRYSAGGSASVKPCTSQVHGLEMASDYVEWSKDLRFLGRKSAGTFA